MNISFEDSEDLRIILSRPAFKLVLATLDEIVDRIEKEVISFPLSGSPNEAMLGLNNKRHQAQGAISLRNAFKSKIEELKKVGG